MLQLLQCVLRSRIDISVPGVAVEEEVRLAGMAIKGDGTVLPRKSGSSVIRNGDAAQDRSRQAMTGGAVGDEPMR
jgi:hypothetical protein